MRARARAGVVLAAALSGCGGGSEPPLGPTPAPSPSAPTFEIVAPPPEGSLYHGVYPGGRTGEEDDLTPDDLRAYEQAAGKTAAWVYFSHNWYRERRFPAETAAWIRAAGSVPFVRLMLRSSAEQGRPERTYGLERVAAGELDADLRAWARGARDFGAPLLAEYGTEMNGEWFPWNAVWNGRGAGPGRFREAYRRIVRLSREEGAGNIQWVFHVNDEDVPDVSWNRLEEYYPGDEWVDWIGVSVYGAQTPLDDEWPAFRGSMDAVYPRLEALARGKPIAVLEFGATARNRRGDQALWAENALRDLVAPRWGRVAGFAWWNETWQNDDDPRHDTDMRVQANPELAAVFQRLVAADPRVLGRVLLARVPRN